MDRRLVVAIALVALAACGGDEPAATPRPTSTALRTPVPGPSQSAADAQRDGIPAEVAALPYDDRVNERARMRAPEGTWIISRFFDPPKAVPKDVADEYAEVLLLDNDETRVLRAFPFRGVPPTWITLTDNALYCGRAGDGGLPYTMVCRIDRKTFVPTVKIFTAALGTWIPSEHPRHWVVIGYDLEMYDLVATDKALYAKDRNDRWTWLDPNTLTVVQPATAPDASPRPRRSANPL